MKQFTNPSLPCWKENWWRRRNRKTDSEVSKLVIRVECMYKCNACVGKVRIM